MIIIGLALVVVFGQLSLGAAVAVCVSRACRLGALGVVMLVPLLGLAVVGGVTLVAGHLGLLGAGLPWALAVAGGSMALLDRQGLAEVGKDAWRGAAREWKLAPVSVSAVLLGFALALVASFAPPSRVDEVEYHWAAPVHWVAQGRWVDSPYRHVDGFPLMEIVYTNAATLNSYAGAHLMHLSTLVAVACAAMVAARAVKPRSTDGPVEGPL